jgi:hypothetical protein
MRVVFATRSMNDLLFEASGQLLGQSGATSGWQRFRLQGTDSLGYFRELLRLDADWVVNIDEDAFVLAPGRLTELIRRMEQGGHAACGMPDGGVVRIRRHNPAGCNAFFNIFDMRRVRPIWANWNRVVSAGPRPEHQRLAVPFATRTTFAFDHFERYYGVFFSLLDAGERILYLDAEVWQDGVSTLLKDPAGAPLLIHCWYTRNWPSSYHTRQRYQAVLNHARQTQGLDPSPPVAAEKLGLVSPPVESNGHRWDSIYQATVEAQPYGDSLTYQKAAQFLGGLAEVEDWGCGWAWFRRYLPAGVRYKGIDGSSSQWVDEVADLAAYTSKVEGILLRHVLEHNYTWQAVLSNAVKSFTRRLVLILFTPFSDVTQVLAVNQTLGVPDIAFARTDLIRCFTGLKWRLEENLPTNTQYGIEHVFYLEKP